MHQFFGISFEYWQIVAIFLIFCWGGFVRSGIGFGGAALTLPLLLLVHQEPLFFLPIIGAHLIFFGVISLFREFHLVDWSYLRKLLSVITIPKMIGVFGLLQLPNNLLLIIIYGVSFYFSLGYLLKRYKHNKSKVAEYCTLMLGGYVSGTALSGAPAIVPIAAKYVSKEQLRSTLFVLWLILVLVKLGAFYITGLSFQFQHHLWLLPAATIGHFIGLRFNRWLRNLHDDVFYLIIGVMLLLLSALGMLKVDWEEVFEILVFW